MLLVIIAAVVAIAFVALKAMDVPPPQWLINIICIVAVAVRDHRHQIRGKAIARL